MKLPPTGPEPEVEPPIESKEKRKLERRSWWLTIIDFFFGYDYFISYAWSDGRIYAQGLEERLRLEHRFRCFLDSEEFAKGQNWRLTGRRAIRKTGRLILVGSPGSLKSEPVLDEVIAFKKTKRLMVPIAFGDSLQVGKGEEVPLLEQLSRDYLDLTEDPEQLEKGPSDHTIQELAKSFDLTRQDAKRFRWIAAVAVVMTVLAAWSFYSASRARSAEGEANNQAELATSQARRANIEARKALRQAQIAEGRRKLAEARRLAAEARLLSEEDPTGGLRGLLEAERLASVSEAHQGLLDGLARFYGQGLYSHPAPVSEITVSPDGNILVSGDEDGNILAFSKRSDNRLRTLAKHEDKITLLALDAVTGQVLSHSDRDDDRSAYISELWDDGRFSLGKRGSIRAVGADRDGRVYSGDDSGNLTGFQLVPGSAPEPIWQMPSGHSGIRSVVVVQGGGGLLTQGGSLLKLWQLSGEEKPKLVHQVAKSIYSSLKADPGGRWLAPRDVPGVLVELQTGRILVHDLPDSSARFAAFDSGPKRLALGLLNNNIPVYTLQPLAFDEPQTVLQGHQSGSVASGLESIVFSPDGQWLISSGQDYGLKFWRFPEKPRGTLAPSFTISSHRAFRYGSGVRALEVTQGELFTGGFDGEIRRTTIRQNRPQAALPRRPTSQNRVIRFLAATPDEEYLVDIGRDARACLWRFEGEQAQEIQCQKLTEPRTVLKRGRPLTVATPDSRRVLAGVPGHTAVLWDISGETAQVSEESTPWWTEDLLAAAASPNGLFLALCRQNLGIDLVNLQTLEVKSPLATDAVGGDCKGAKAIAVSDSGRFLALRPETASPLFWDLEDSPKQAIELELPAPPEGHDEDAYNAKWDLLISPNDRFLVLVDGHQVYLWERGSGVRGARLLRESAEEIYLHESSPDRASHVLISRESRWLAIGNNDGYVYLWDLELEDPTLSSRRLGPLRDGVTALDISANSRWLAAGSYAADSWLWDLSYEDSQPTSLVLRDQNVWNLAADFGKEHLYLGTSAGVAVWPLDIKELVSLAEDSVSLVVESPAAIE